MNQQQGVYSVLDAKAGAYAIPFFAPTDPHAIRSFSDLVNDPNTVPGRHPEDFSLHKIGDFDIETAALVNGKLHVLANGVALIKGMDDE